jgi:curved DNA-binding protein CbpA
MARRPDFKYLVGATSVEDARKIYKKKALELHPDRGGSTEAFQQLNEEMTFIKEGNYVAYPIKLASYGSSSGTKQYYYQTPRERARNAAEEFAERMRQSEERKRGDAEDRHNAWKQQQEFDEAARQARQHMADQAKKAEEQARKYKDEPKPIRTPLEYGKFIDYMTAMKATIENKGYKKSSLWFKFKEFCMDRGYAIQKIHIEHICQYAGNNSGWVYFKWEECKSEKLV